MYCYVVLTLTQYIYVYILIYTYIYITVLLCVCINDEHGQEIGRLRDFSNCISFSKRLWHFDLIECERDNTAVAIYYCTYYIYVRCAFVRRHPSTLLYYLHTYIIHIIIITIVSFQLLLYNIIQQYRRLIHFWSYLQWEVGAERLEYLTIFQLPA